MATIRRLSDSCVVVTTDDGATLIDPGYHTFDTGEIDLGTIGDIQRVLITHAHGDHMKPEFVKWLLDRGEDVTVFANEDVVGILAERDIPASTDDPSGVSSRDGLHALTPMGTAPPNRSYTISDLLTHPGDSFELTSSAPVLALPLITPWASMTQSMEFARALAPQQAVPIHDFYTSRAGRDWAVSVAKAVLAKSGIEVVPLDWGDGYTV